MSLSVKILGSNSASFAHNRHHTSQVVQAGSELFMVDCGEGTQLRCKKFGVKLSRINNIFISHLHGDHYYGLMGLLSTMHLYGREKDLLLVGPPGLAEIITVQFKYSDTDLNFKIDYREWIPGTIQTIFDSAQLSVETIPLDHRVSCSGYLFKEKPKGRRLNREVISEQLPPNEVHQLKDGIDVLNEDGSIKYLSKEVTLPPIRSFSYAYCSDTRYSESIIPQISNVDLLYHEATFMEDMRDRASNTYHTTTKQAGEIAIKADVSKLIIGHFSTRYKDLREMLTETKSTFKNSYLATEGEVFEIKP